MQEEEQADEEALESKASQVSLRFIFFVITIVAMSFALFRYAWANDSNWAICSSYVIIVAALCFMIYGLLFIVAQMISDTHLVISESNLNLVEDTQTAESKSE